MRRTTLSLLALVLSAAVSAQTDSLAMRRVFVDIPDSLLPLLPQRTRHDMVDFLANGMEARVRNRLGEEVVLRELTDNYALVEASPLSRMEMKLLPLVGDSAEILAVVSTVRGPAADSHVEFYDANWQKLPALTLPRPDGAAEQGPPPPSQPPAAAPAIATLTDLCPIEIRLSPEAPVFELRIDPTILTQKEKDAATILAHPLFYDWDGAAFRRREQP